MKSGRLRPDGAQNIVDTYGGSAFSGKDPTKVDRSATYAVRYVAKNIVAAGLARQCQIQVPTCTKRPFCLMCRKDCLR